MHHSPERQANLAEAALEHLSEAVLVYGADLVITDANQSARNLLRMDRGQLVGRQCREAFGCPACDPECGIRVGLRTAGRVREGTLLAHGGNGRNRMARLKSGQLSAEAGSRGGAFAILTEISDETAAAKPEIVAESPAMQDVLRLARRVAASEAGVVLIEGDSGAGKELIAREVHYRSLRRAGPFVAVNCAAIPETLLESELFGHEKGAFTDARAVKLGIFEMAQHGTLFLDEIGELPVALQAKLLRVLEERSFRRLGGLNDIALDVRVVAATNQNLGKAVREGTFRQDLYFRLNVFQLSIPPLRERREDILALASLFIGKYNARFHRNIQGISATATQYLLEHEWPGNVRELRNVIERGVLLEAGDLLTAEILPEALLETPIADKPSVGEQVDGSRLIDAERQLMCEVLERTAGNQSEAARLLGMTRDTLRYRAVKHQLWARKPRVRDFDSNREVIHESTNALQAGTVYQPAL